MAEAANLWIMEGANLIVGGTGDENQPGSSTHLSLQELKLPGLEENYVDHNAGGFYQGIEINTHMNRLEATFNLAGWQPHVMQFIRNEGQADAQYTAYGLIRNKRSGELMNSIAYFQGRMGRANPTAYRRGDLFNHEYSIRGIMQYELLVQMQPDAYTSVYFFDFFTCVRRVLGQDVNSSINRLLAIPTGV